MTLSIAGDTGTGTTTQYELSVVSAGVVLKWYIFRYQIMSTVI